MLPSAPLSQPQETVSVRPYFSPAAHGYNRTAPRLKWRSKNQQLASTPVARRDCFKSPYYRAGAHFRLRVSGSLLGNHATSAISLNSRRSLRHESPPSSLRYRYPNRLAAYTTSGSSAWIVTRPIAEFGSA